jgi:hypothetical protein
MFEVGLPDLLGEDEDEGEELIWIFLGWGNVDGC